MRLILELLVGRNGLFKIELLAHAYPVLVDAHEGETHFDDATTDRLDGLRLDWPGRWLLVRASNTEPIVRLIAEAESMNDAQELCDSAAALLD